MMRPKLTPRRRAGRQAQVGHGVFDFFALVEAGAADDFVRQVGAQEGFFERAGLGVGAVEHGKVVELAVFGAAEFFDLAHDGLGFLDFVVDVDDADAGPSPASVQSFLSERTRFLVMTAWAASRMRLVER
jgi:hypothetical protein